MLFISSIPVIIFVLLLLFILGGIYLKFKRNRNFDFGSAGISLPKYEDIPLCREIPCGGDLYRAYWVAYEYNVVDFNDSRNGIVGAILLKLLYEKRISIVQNDENRKNFKIDLSLLEHTDNNAENDFIDMLKESAGENMIVENEEFKQWCKLNYVKIERLYTTIIRYATRNLVKDGYITQVKKGNKVKNVVDSRLKEEAIKLYGLKKFLASYSLIDERDANEVHMWEEYLIYAQLFGMADKANSQLAKIYPDLRVERSYNDSSLKVLFYDALFSYFEYFESNKIEVIE